MGNQFPFLTSFGNMACHKVAYLPARLTDEQARLLDDTLAHLIRAGISFDHIRGRMSTWSGQDCKGMEGMSPSLPRRPLQLGTTDGLASVTIGPQAVTVACPGQPASARSSRRVSCLGLNRFPVPV